MSLSMVKELFRTLTRKPVTRKYPYERREIPERFRGRIVIDYDKCIGCGLCARFCPAIAIKMVFVETEKGKKRKPLVQIFRCIFCGQCSLVCPRKAISYSKEFELATYNKEELVLEPKSSEKGGGNGSS